VLTFGCIALLCALAQAPAITVAAPEIDLGSIADDQPVLGRFEVRNTGQSDLHLLRIVPACGCTSTLPGKRVLAPGEAAGIEVRFNPKGAQGRVVKTLQVFTDDPGHASVELALRAEIVQELRAEEPGVAFLEVGRKELRKGSIRLLSGNGLPVRTAGAKVLCPAFMTAVLRQEGEDAWLDLALAGSLLPGGAGFEHVVVRTARGSTLRVEVAWSRQVVIRCEPERVAWVEAAGVPRRTRVALTQVSGRAFRVLSATCDHPLVQVRILPAPPGARQELELTLAGTVAPGLLQTQVLVKLDDPGQPDLAIRVSAAIQDASGHVPP